MKKMYDLAVCIGRFQPVHNGHVALLQRAAELSDNTLVLIGSAHSPRTFKNPFTYIERKNMVLNVLETINKTGHFCVNAIRDSMYNDQAWVVSVQEAVKDYVWDLFGPKDARVVIVGHFKDDSSYYLNMFPQWDFVDVQPVEPMDATSVRDLYFSWTNGSLNFIRGVVPTSTYNFLWDFMDKPDYAQIIREREFIADYKKQFAGLKYPPVFVTADAVVIQSGHVLMIRRKSEPGKGLWALPGGFLNVESDKSMQDAAIRELKEETGIKVPVPVLVGNIKNNRVFDAINRSARGRTITHAFNIVLPDGELPKVKGQDDAEKARWVPISEVKPEECFEDHYEIITYFAGV